MSWLQSVGQALVKGGAVVQNFVPLGVQVASVVNPGAAVTVEGLAAIIASVEAIGQQLNASGPDKLKAAVPLVTQAVLQSGFMRDHRIARPEVFARAMEEFAQATVDMLQSLDPEGSPATPKT